MAIYIFITNVIAGIGVIALKFIFGRARPELYFSDKIYGFKWFEVEHEFSSFPSGHTITAVSTAVALSQLFPKYRYLFALSGILIASSRVVGTDHYLSDVVVATLLGYIVAIELHSYLLQIE